MQLHIRNRAILLISHIKSLDFFPPNTVFIPALVSVNTDLGSLFYVLLGLINSVVIDRILADVIRIKVTSATPGRSDTNPISASRCQYSADSKTFSNHTWVTFVCYPMWQEGEQNIQGRQRRTATEPGLTLIRGRMGKSASWDLGKRNGRTLSETESKGISGYEWECEELSW